MFRTLVQDHQETDMITALQLRGKTISSSLQQHNGMCFNFVYTDMGTNFILNIFTSTQISRKLQGSPTYFFPRATKSFPFGPKIQETPPGKIG